MSAISRVVCIYDKMSALGGVICIYDRMSAMSVLSGAVFRRYVGSVLKEDKKL